MTSAIDHLETNAIAMGDASRQQTFSLEQNSIQKWQDNCMGACHYATYTDPSGSTGPRPVTPLTDRYSTAMGDAAVDVMQFAGGASTIFSLRVPTGRRSDVDARNWYLAQEDEIPNLIDTELSLQEQARRASDFRNFIRTEARNLMLDRNKAIDFDVSDPNLSWAEVVNKYTNKGHSGDDLYIQIINSSQRSRTSINRSLGIMR